MKLFSSARRRDRDAAGRLYAACVTAARAPELFRACGVPDTLDGRFEMVALHLFPVLHRLSVEPGDDPELARGVSESFVTDMDAAMREMGVGDVVVPKRMKKMFSAFAGRVGAYTAALQGGEQALEEAVARNVFPDGDPQGHAPALARHARGLVAVIRELPLASLRAGDVTFPPPPGREIPA